MVQSDWFLSSRGLNSVSNWHFIKRKLQRRNKSYTRRYTNLQRDPTTSKNRFQAHILVKITKTTKYLNSGPSAFK
ncbi:hypothetical protein YC2023_088178 [Brassica napus]|uniref:Uncharacterized protein n=1 Tax=Brassica oleracea TaxID=3712 RepID=A0A3P6F1D8_BRAOL|nr:unnamed protein product [Brassica oleracea]